MKLLISGSVFVALALVAIMGLSSGSAFETIKPGLGWNVSSAGWVSLAVLIILAVIAIQKKD